MSDNPPPSGKETRAKINQMIEEADALVQDNKFEEAMEKYRECLPLAKEVGWELKFDQIQDLIAETKKKEQQVLSKKDSMEQQAKRSNKLGQIEQIIEQADNFVQKAEFDAALDKYQEAIPITTDLGLTLKTQQVKEMIAEVKVKKQQFEAGQLSQEKLQEQAKLSAKILKLIEEGDKLVLDEKFDHALEIYDECLSLVEQTGSELKKKQISELIQEAKRKKALSAKKQSQQENLQKEEEERRAKEKRLAEARERLHAKREKEQEEKRMQLARKKLEEEQKSNEAFNILENASNLVKSQEFEEAIPMYEEAISLFEEIGWTAQVKTIQDSLVTVKEQQKATLKKLEKKKEHEHIVEESREHAQKQQELAEKYHQKQREKLERARGEFKEIDDLIESADAALLEGKFLDAIETYQKCLDLAKKTGSELKIKQVQEFLADAKKRQNEYDLQAEQMAKLEQDLADKKDKDARLREARERLRQKEVEERDARKRALLEKKQKEEEYTNRAFTLLDEGSALVKQEHFSEAIPKYEEAIKLFEDAGWGPQAKTVRESLQTIQEQYTSYQERLEKESEEAIRLRKLREEDLQNTKKLDEAQKKRDQDREAEVEELRQAQATKEQFAELAYRIIDVAIDLKKKGEFDEAIEKYREARKVFEEIGYAREADGMLGEISHTREEQKKAERMAAFRQQKQAEAQQQKEEMERQIEAARRREEKKQADKNAELKKKLQDEKFVKEMSQEAFQFIDEAENLNRKYEADKKLYGPDIDSPYEEIVELYRKAFTNFRDAGLASEAEKIQNTIQFYRRKKDTDEKEREIRTQKEQERQQYLKDLEKQAHAKEEEERKKQQELQMKRLKESEEKERWTNITEKADKLASEAIKALDNHEYQEAIQKYRKVKDLYAELDWRDGIDRIDVAISTMIKKEKEYQIQQERLCEIQEKKEEELRKQDEFIKRSEKEQKKRENEEQKRKLEILTKKQSEEKIRESIVQSLEIASNFALKNEFDAAIEKYRETLEIFDRFSWPLKEQQVKELISETRQKKDLHFRRIEQEKHQEEERRRKEAEMDAMLKKAEQDRKKQEIEERKRKAEQLKKVREEGEKKDLAYQYIDEADNLFNRHRPNEAVDKLYQALDMFRELGWKKESEALEGRIKKEKQQIQISIEMRKEQAKSQKEQELRSEAFQAMDEAERHLRKNRFSEAIEQYKLSLENFETLGWDREAKQVQQQIVSVEEKINERELHRQLAKQRELEKDRSPEKAFELLDEMENLVRNKKFKKAISAAKQAQEIFAGLDWEKEATSLVPKIAELEAEYDKRKEMIDLAKQKRKERELKEIEEEDERLQRAKERKERREKRRKNLLGD